MIQKIIVAIIVGFAIIIAVKRIYDSVFKKKENCGGCSSGECSGCPLVDLKKDIENAKNTQKTN
ncbi:MAG: hypothetical protein K9J13_11580 [Saprospiraceae bacterium]|nr:hypothetical protein [Saprospiraceae bacterium]